MKLLLVALDIFCQSSYRSLRMVSYLAGSVTFASIDRQAQPGLPWRLLNGRAVAVRETRRIVLLARSRQAVPRSAAAASRTGKS